MRKSQKLLTKHKKLGVVRAYHDAFFAVHPTAYEAFVDILWLFRCFPTAQILAELPSAQAAGCFEAEALSRRLSPSVPADRMPPEPVRVLAGPPVFQPHPRLYHPLTEEA